MTLGEGIARTNETVFPAADALLGMTLVAAGVTLSATTFRWTVPGDHRRLHGLYLGVLDLTFYLSHQLYSVSRPATLLALALNLGCIGVGGLALYWGWRLWREG